MTINATPTLASLPITWRYPEDEQRLWSQDRLHYPDPVTPLEFSLIETGVDHGMTKAAHAYGIPITVHDRHIYGYLYVAIEAPESAPPEDQLNTAMSALCTTWETIWLPEIQEHLAWWANFDQVNASWPALLDHLSETERRWLRVWEIHFLLFMPSMLAISQFADLHADLFENAEPFAAYQLLTGIPNKTMESGQQLWELSRRILQSPEVHRIFSEASAGDVLAKLAKSDAGRTFSIDFQRYLDVHGYRADKLSLHYPFWIEDPAPAIRTLQGYIQQPDRDLTSERARAAHESERHIANLRTHLKDYPQPVREQVEFLLKAAREGAFLKEEHGYWIDYKASYCVRQLLLTIGDRLVAEGVLQDRDDLFYLRLDEVKTLMVSPGTDIAGYRERVAERKSQAELFVQATPPSGPPPFLGTLPAEPPPQDPITRMFMKVEGEALAIESGSDSIAGHAGSPGVARGTAKVVHSLGEAGKLQPGDILVADTTAPPWTPLFATVSGLVTNSGGILSHSAVVAREYGIPAVVGASTATERLKDGQMIEVDGNRGIVSILDIEVPGH